MLARNLIRVYRMMRELGLTKSKQDYCRFWLSRGRTYLRDLEVRDREDVLIPVVTVKHLRTRLRAVSDRVPRRFRNDIEHVIEVIDEGYAVAELLSRRR